MTNLVKPDTIRGMSRQVNIYEAKTRLSELVDAAARGEEIVIAKNGKPLAKLVAQAAKVVPGKRALGQWREAIDPLFHSDPQRFWKEWLEADATIAKDFARTAGFSEGDENVWPSTSSTRTPSSGQRRRRTPSVRRRAKR